jgi:hypothetical protein
VKRKEKRREWMLERERKETITTERDKINDIEENLNITCF